MAKKKVNEEAVENTAVETSEVQPTYEQLAAAYNELKMRSDKNDVITRLQFDFLALEHTADLPKNYVNAVVRDVMTLLPMEGIDIQAEYEALKNA